MAAIRPAFHKPGALGVTRRLLELGWIRDASGLCQSRRAGATSRGAGGSQPAGLSRSQRRGRVWSASRDHNAVIPSRLQAILLPSRVPMSRPMSDSTRDLPADLREWAEMLARHHRSLRRPLATGRALGDAADDDRDNDRHGEQERPLLSR